MEQHDCLVWTAEMQRFVRNFQMPVAASVVDGGHASRVVWPDAQGIVVLRRLDVFDATSPPPRLRLVMDPEKSAQLKHKSLEWRYRQSVCLFRDEVPFGVEVVLSTVTDPERDRVCLEGHVNRRDLSVWTPYDSAFAYRVEMAGTEEFAVHWSGHPDRYSITAKSSVPPPGWKPVCKFFAYPLRQFYVLQTDEETTRWQGYWTYNVQSGKEVRTHPGWELHTSFYAFEKELPGATRVFVQEAASEPYRMRVSKHDYHETAEAEKWITVQVFYVFDLPVPGTCRLSVQQSVANPFV